MSSQSPVGSGIGSDTGIHDGIHDEIHDGSGLGKVKGLFFLAAGLSFLLSVYLFFSGDYQRGIFVGIWVPSILSAGTLLLAGVRNE